jgi:signal peptidase II
MKDQGAKADPSRRKPDADGGPEAGGAPGSPAVWRERILFLAFAIGGAVADVLSKEVVFSALGVKVVELQGRPFALAEREIPLIGETFKLQAAVNPGAVFGIFQGKWLFLVVFGLVALGIIGWVLYKSRNAGVLLVSGLGFVCAGALGNLWDRLFFDGVVRDFLAFTSSLISPFVEGGRWPNFNLADVWIVVGIPLILIGDWRNTHKAGAPEKGGNSP